MFNEEMTSKMQPATWLRHRYRKDLGTRWSCFGCEKKMADISLVSGETIAKNMAKTARRQLGGRHLLFGEYLRSWTNLNVHYRR